TGKIMSMSRTEHTMFLTVDLTSFKKVSDWSPVPTQKANILAGISHTCFSFTLAPYARTDAHWYLIICATNASTPTTGNYHPKGLVAASDAGKDSFTKWDLNDLFAFETGRIMDNEWLHTAQQAAQAADKGDCLVCMGARPTLVMTPTIMDNSTNATHCMLDIMSKDVPSENCTWLDHVYPVTNALDVAPQFTPVSAFRFTCFHGPGGGPQVGTVDVGTFCHTNISVSSAVNLAVARSDVWWYCGHRTALGTLPSNWTGVCILMSFIMPISITPISAHQLEDISLIFPSAHARDRLQKRDVRSNMDSILGASPVYFDAIGQPRNIPPEFKLLDEVADGWSGAAVQAPKNAERINYIHYNVQRLANFTRDAVDATHEQLSATSLMAYQNRVALDFLLAEKGGVCSMFQDTCCTFIPNNTAPDGSLTRALQGLRALSAEMKAHSGVDDWFNKWLDKTFGKWRAFAVAFFMSAAIFLSVLIVCGCCGVPCMRSLFSSGMYTLLLTDDCGNPPYVHIPLQDQDGPAL
uniref:Uncharacterized protein n=1 Tax=Salarias fasciatus TaxID=181472 RepID=A0A672GHA6_SALFA